MLGSMERARVNFQNIRFDLYMGGGNGRKMWPITAWDEEEVLEVHETFGSLSSLPGNG
jgi:hypothetical protein